MTRSIVVQSSFELPASSSFPLRDSNASSISGIIAGLRTALLQSPAIAVVAEWSESARKEDGMAGFAGVDFVTAGHPDAIRHEVPDAPNQAAAAGQNAEQPSAPLYWLRYRCFGKE